MKNLLLKIFLSLSFITIFSVQAAEDDVATVVLKKGDVKARLKNGQTISLAINQKVPVGATIQTQQRSFVRLIFNDKSMMNLGPSSQMVIQSFPKNEAGIVKLINGQIRAEVSKNYMNIEDKAKSKLFIQTKTASMGIRGTDFQVNYNPANENSSLIVFEGKVALGNVDRSLKDQDLDQKKLEEIVSSTTAVMVRQGQFSAVNLNIAERPLIPSKISPKQLDALKSNTSGLEETNIIKDKKKPQRDIIPPGVDTTMFVNAPVEVVKAEIKEAQGFYNDKTGEYKPAAGTIIDLKTVNIIPPPEGSKYDNATKTFVINENLGKVNDKTGQYEAPKGLELTDSGKIIAKDETKKIVQDSTKKDEKSSTSSESATPVATSENKNETKKDTKQDSAETKVATTNNSDDKKDDRKDDKPAPVAVAPVAVAPVAVAPVATTPAVDRKDEDAPKKEDKPVAAAPAPERKDNDAPKKEDKPVAAAPAPERKEIEVPKKEDKPVVTTPAVTPPAVVAPKIPSVVIDISKAIETVIAVVVAPVVKKDNSPATPATPATPAKTTTPAIAIPVISIPTVTIPAIKDDDRRNDDRREDDDRRDKDQKKTKEKDKKKRF